MVDQVLRPAGPDGGFIGSRNLIRFQKNTLGFLTDVAREYGDIAYFRMVAFHFYLLSSPEAIYEVFINQGKKLEKWERQTVTWSDAVGHSTLTMEGDIWRKHRRLLNPAFHRQTINRYFDIVVRHTDRLLDRWQDGNTYEMMFEMMRTTMGIISSIIFSVDDIEKDAADLNRALTDVFEVLTARTTAFQQIPGWLPTRDNLRIRNATKTIEAFILPLIAERRKEGKDYGDVLSDLIFAKDEETGEGLTDREICNELKTLFGAGHETTALMLMWTMYLLATNPEIQGKLQHEVDHLLGERSPVLDDLKTLEYTDMVLNESMRLFPPAWSLMVRQAKEDIELNGYTIPKESLFLIPMWVVHRNPNVFTEPLVFNPERFNDESRRGYAKYAYFPFGGGPHICLGSQLAMFEGQIILPMMIQRFEFVDVPRDPIELQALLTLRPRGGLKLKLKSR
jgi:cytochrome P450